MTPSLFGGLKRALRNADAFLITSLVNVRYTSGFTGSSAFVLVTPDEAHFVTDFRYAEQSEREVEGMRIHIANKRGIAAVSALCRKLGVKTLAFEDTVSYAYTEALRSKGLKLAATSAVVENIRACKHQHELEAIERAVRRAEEAFLAIKKHIRSGVTERSIALRLEEKLKRGGTRRLPFESIVASGPNSSLPHAKPTGRRLQPGDLLTIDWGGECDGYYSDMTRSFLIKGPGMARKKQIYHLVAEAQRAGLAALAAGANVREVDSSARDVIKNAGHAEHFGHGLGHGVGLEVHEAPSLSPASKGKLKDGMVVTVEPGVYVPGLGGVRIEDMAVVEGQGCRRLTRLPRGLEILP